MGRSSRSERPEPRPLRPVVTTGAAAVGGLVAVLADLHPTGTGWLDPIVVFVAAALVAVAAAAAPWWASAGVCVVAATLAPGWGWALVGLAGAAAAAAGSFSNRHRDWSGAIASIAAIGVLSRLEHVVFPGFTAVVSLGLLGALHLIGSARWPAPLRRRTRQALGVLAAAALVAVGGLAIAAWSASGPLRAGNREARLGMRALETGDLPGAATAFADAGHALDEARRDLSVWWTRPAAMVPVAAQHRAAATALTTAAATALERSSAALARLDPAQLALTNGAVDIDTISDMATPLGEIDTALAGLARTIDDQESVWLAPPLADRLDTFGGMLGERRPALARARTAIDLAPDLLGRNGPRRYLIAFLHPGEARGLGGHMGNFAELTITEGQFELADFGRSVNLNRGGTDPGGRVITGPAEFIERWGRFGFMQEDGTTDLMPWSNISMPPDLPMVGEVMAQLYPQSGGGPIDGVIALLPEALSALMRSTGPVEVPGISQMVTADNVVRFIEKDQYKYYDGSTTDRIDGLEYLALTTVGRLLDGGMQEPTRLLEAFGPLAADGRIMVWSAHPDEERLFVQAGVGGNFPALEGRDGIAVTIDNGGANKLDAYLQVSTEYRCRVDPATGAATATATITLTNTVDPVGKPDYAVGNAVGLPRGTNRMMVSAYSALRATAIGLDDQPVTIDGRYASVGGSTTFGWNTAEIWVDVDPGTTRVVTVQLVGTLDPSRNDIVVHRQPLAIPQRYDLARA